MSESRTQPPAFSPALQVTGMSAKAGDHQPADGSRPLHVQWPQTQALLSALTPHRHPPPAPRSAPRLSGPASFLKQQRSLPPLLGSSPLNPPTWDMASSPVRNSSHAPSSDRLPMDLGPQPGRFPLCSAVPAHSCHKALLHIVILCFQAFPIKLEIA